MNSYHDENHFKKRPSYFTLILVALLSAFIGGGIAAYIVPMYFYDPSKFNANKNAVNSPQNNIEIVAKSEKLSVVPAVVKKAMPSVVGITTITVEQDIFFGIRKGEGVGTGVIVDNRGYILTNSHVINDGKTEEVKVLLYDGRTLKADVLWQDPLLDLAIVKVNAQNLPVASLGNSDQLTVGELTIAIGNPLGLAFERTVTSGIISGLERSIALNEIESIEGLVQTDASINPGNSGGPLLNAKGEVIGINTAKIQTGEGLGFAIPINTAKPIVDEFIKKGEFTKVYLGIKGDNVQRYIMQYGNNLGTEQGVLVYKVYSNSPVSRGGIKEGDVILAINNKNISTMGQLVRQLYQYRPGDKVKIEILRAGKKITREIVLEAMPRR